MSKLRDRHEVRIRLLTPLAKYMATESADEITRNAIQVHGGLGFMAESEVGKLHNDAIITTIYEGTSEIQVSFALKEIGKGALAVVFDEIGKELEGLSEPPLAEYADKVRAGMELIVESEIFPAERLSELMTEANELTAILVTCVKNVKSKRSGDK